MKRLSLFIVLLLGLPTASALAADLPIPIKLPASSAFSWTGFYVGANAGGAWGSERISQTLVAPPPFLAVDTAAVSAASSPTLQPGNALAGLQAGYNQQWGNWVVGGELDFDYLGLQGSNASTLPFPSTLPGGAAGPPTVTFSTATTVSTTWLFTARPRFGWAVDNWLVYVTGGLALGRETFNQSVAIVFPFVETTSVATVRAGWTVGAGVEYAIVRNWSLRGEYLHVDLGTMNTTATLTPPFPGLVMSGSVRLTTEIARGGINYRF
jgi:outer membrane immunogenic protein